MIVASPESYLCFVNHPLETTTDDPWRASPSPLRRWRKRPPWVQGETPCRLLEEGQFRKADSADIFGVLVNGSCGTQSRVEADPQRREEDGRKGFSNTEHPEYPQGRPASKANDDASATKNCASHSHCNGATREEHRCPEDSAQGEAKATTGAGGDPRPLIDVEREGLKFKMYDCERCNTIVFVGQHVCFGCNLRLRKTANFSSASRRFMAVSRKNLLRDVCRTTELTAQDIRPTKDVTGKLPKSPEAATLERAKNHLIRAKQKGFESIEDRYDKDPVFAANMMEDGQTVSNIRIWECLTRAVIPATQRSAAQRALNLGASQVPMGETAEDYPARTVYFCGLRGETLKAANLVTDVTDPNVCVGFGGTFFNLKNFAELLYHQPQITSTLITFQGHWRIPPVNNIEDFRQYLIQWFRANEEQMIAAYDQQMKVARDNRKRQLAAKASSGGDPRPETSEGQNAAKGKGKDKGKGKGKPKGKR